MCVCVGEGGVPDRNCPSKAVRITKEAAKTSSSKEQITYIIQKRTHDGSGVLLRGGESLGEGRAGCQGTAHHRNGVHSHISWPIWWSQRAIPADLRLGVAGDCLFCCDGEGCVHNEMQEFYLHTVSTGINWIPL